MPLRIDRKESKSLGFADAEQSLYHILVRDLVLYCRIGVYPHERETAQRIRVNVDLAVREPDGSAQDDIVKVVSYEDIADGVRDLAEQEHVNLVETLAERIAQLCLSDKRVARARVRVEKLDVYSDAASVGVEIERRAEEPFPRVEDLLPSGRLRG